MTPSFHLLSSSTNSTTELKCQVKQFQLYGAINQIAEDDKDTYSWEEEIYRVLEIASAVETIEQYTT